VNYFIFHLLSINILINVYFAMASLEVSNVLIIKYQVMNKTNQVYQ